jgi:16S rRNA U516 pseudouridylate synthase RsuA-like enzyme
MKELADTKVRLSEVLAESGTHSKESEEASRQVVQLTGEVARLEADVSSAQTVSSENQHAQHFQFCYECI